MCSLRSLKRSEVREHYKHQVEDDKLVHKTDISLLSSQMKP